MTGNERRDYILSKLCENPVSASSLAAEFSVSRQIIVSDIALLRAAGNPIESTPRGYVIKQKTDRSGIIKVIMCKHLNEGVEDELYTIIDNGAKILDVIVEHDVYGQIQINLDIASRYDCDQLLRKLKKSAASPLAGLTSGVHFHTILCPDERCYKRILEVLRAKKILFEEVE
ncbi:MAG: transcription repressor NadR [Proteocatella sp.]